MRRKEMKQLLEERIERIALLETRIDTMEQLVDGYRSREQSIIDTLRDAQEKASRAVSEATAQAEAVVSEAEGRASSIVSEARRQAETVLADAEARAAAMRDETNRHADKVLNSARDESANMLRQAEDSLREYREMFETFNAVIERNAAEVQETAERYAQFLRERKVDAPETAEAPFAEPFSPAAARDLPDPDGDPARLMQNIYRLQNRDIPQSDYDAQQEQAASPSAAEETRDETEAEGPSWPKEWGEQSPPEQGEPETPPDEYEAAGVGTWTEDFEPPEDASAQEQGTPVEPADEEDAAAYAEEPADEEDASERAAEPADKEDAAAYAEEPADKPEPDFAEPDADDAARAFDAAQSDEPREWEPEPEPETANVPTVGQLMPDGAAEDNEVSLDQLLDEIIQAGE